MSDIVNMDAEVRERAGKGAARATRRAGRVPAVVYGGKSEPVMISLDPIQLHKQLHSTGFFSHVVELKVGKDAHRVLPRDVQFHPVTDVPLHVDFLRVTKDSVIEVAVVVEFINDLASPGLKRGGVLNIVRHDVELVCSPDDIPEKLVADLTGLNIGDSVHISSIELPEGVRPSITDRDFTIATLAAPSSMKSEDEEEEGAETEGEGEEATEE
ncbi:50S ribosomal protein L25/general stress protein Ctc [Magnetospira sp. QH-2]|uniref:50S ribosomal protein L25/general stress protein Ctc n=1 Tax=Magnetospira sp. (strain QH-2) TaxID=1288970 RepID=UPI0003E81AAF|nr:50S ribosomal protein L25/general stress protein Ctc [Magnetospira sp. QH-2]CCQ72275.1 50S ribosomal protein L25 [Magnetospira sp. QH-2]